MHLLRKEVRERIKKQMTTNTMSFNDVDTEANLPSENFAKPEIERLISWDGKEHKVRIVSVEKLAKAPVIGYRYIKDIKRLVASPLMPKKGSENYFYTGTDEFRALENEAKERKSNDYKHNLVMYLIVEELTKEADETNAKGKVIKEGAETRTLKLWEAGIKDAYFPIANGVAVNLKKIEAKHGAINKVWLTVDKKTAMYEEKVSDADLKAFKYKDGVAADMPNVDYYHPMDYEAGLAKFKEKTGMTPLQVAGHEEGNTDDLVPIQEPTEAELAGLPL